MLGEPLYPVKVAVHLALALGTLLQMPLDSCKLRQLCGCRIAAYTTMRQLQTHGEATEARTQVSGSSR